MAGSPSTPTSKMTGMASWKFVGGCKAVLMIRAYVRHTATGKTIVPKSL